MNVKIYQRDAQRNGTITREMKSRKRVSGVILYKRHDELANGALTRLSVFLALAKEIRTVYIDHRSQ